jgi:hypothetical protein
MTCDRMLDTITEDCVGKAGITPSVGQGPILDDPRFTSETDAVEHDKLCHDQIVYQWFIKVAWPSSDESGLSRLDGGIKSLGALQHSISGRRNMFGP